MNEKHVSLPWIVDEECAWVMRGSDFIVADCGGHGALGFANAKFIVKAVNNHDALVEALKHAQGSLVEWQEWAERVHGVEDTPEGADLTNKISKALERVK